MSGAPRIPTVEGPDDEQLAILAKAPARADGTVRNLFLTLLQHPRLLKRFNAFAGTFMAFGLMDVEDRELVILRIAARTSCEYELVQHLPLARETALSEAAIAAVLVPVPPVDALSAHQARLVAAADQMLTTGAVEDRSWNALAARYSHAEMLELVTLVAFYRMTADVLNVVGIQPEDDLDVEIDWSALAIGRPETVR